MVPSSALAICTILLVNNDFSLAAFCWLNMRVFAYAIERVFLTKVVDLLLISEGKESEMA